MDAGLNFTALFCARRLAFAFAIVFLDQILSNQIYVSMFTTLGMASWHITYLPMMDRWNNFVYLFNELVLLVLTYYIFLFSGYLPTLEQKFMFGYVYLGVLAFSFVVNIGCMGAMTYLSIKKYLDLKQMRKDYRDE